MESTESPVSQESGTSNIVEFLQAIRDIQSIDFDNLRAQFPQSARHTSTDLSEAFMPRLAHTLESQKRETQRIRKQLEEEKRFRDEYFKLFGGKEMKDLNKMLDDMGDNNKRLQEEKMKLEEKNKFLEEEKRKLIAEKNNAVTRLSQSMENQMTDNRTNIVDLSDQNPLNKLGERYTMLYDNQWLHAFEVLTERHRQNEENAIRILLNILTECHNFANKKADKQMNDLVERISGDPKIQVGQEVKLHLRTARKLVNVASDSVLFQECEYHIYNVMGRTKLFLYEKEMKLYVSECFHLCWFLVIQDTPVVFGEKAMKGEVFDPHLYKYYTRSGKLIEFVVWPPLLGEGGSLLAQGVAQPVLHTEIQITKHAWDEGSETIHMERLTRSTRKAGHIEQRPVTPKRKADDLSSVRKDDSNHRLTTEYIEASISSSSNPSSPPNVYVTKAGNAQPAINPNGYTDTGYQMQPVKTSYTETNFAWNQNQNAASQYDKSGDQISVGKSWNSSQKTRSTDMIKQQDFSYEKSTNSITSFQTRGTDYDLEQLDYTERARYQNFIRKLKADGEEQARNCYPYSFERYYSIFLASQVNFQ